MAQRSFEADRITRFSSRRQPLDHAYLNTALAGARRYDRIAGYFSSSILEVAGEAIDAVQDTVRVVCNSGLNSQDVVTAKAAKQSQRLEWNSSDAIAWAEHGPERFRHLYHLLRTGKLAVRVLADEHFGLMHGKAGVITRTDASQTCFLGSVNESKYGWRVNYELLWADDSQAAVAWVQEEFDALWNHPFACALAEAVVADVGRLSRRHVQSLPDWRESAEPASVAVEAPVTRQSVGLWSHQKYFVKLAFDAHKTAQGARFVLADQVGLGKTLQLGMAAQLMALHGERPVLILAPKPLLWQWQTELKSLLAVPSAVWTADGWMDENEILHPAEDATSVRVCPRRIGIVSTGLITHGGTVADELRHMRWECGVTVKSGVYGRS